jgi:hypothetical protein
LIISAIEGFHTHIDRKKNYWPVLDQSRPAVCWLAYPRDERQQSVTDILSCILNKHWAARQHYAIFSLLVAFMGLMASDNVVTTF